MPQTPFFTGQQLSDWLGFTVVPAKAVLAERVVWGWLRPVLSEIAGVPVTERPDVTDETGSPELFAWALELGGIAHENPAGLSSKAFGDVSEAYSGERRDEILALIAAGGTQPEKVPAPRGNFPPAECYPDPALGHRRRW